MQRILVIGSPGSGKSRLSKIMAQKLNLPLIHLDQIFWLPNWTPLEKPVFKEKLIEELKKDRWILDGNFASTLKLRLEYCDHVVFMNYPAWLCILRVLKRVITNHGKTRPDMTEGCNEKLDIEFLKYIRDFKKLRLKQLRNDLDQSGVAVTELKNDRQVRKFIKSLNA